MKREKKPLDVPRRLYGIEETAAYLGLEARSIYNGVAPNSKHPFPIKPKRFGRRVMFDVRDLDAYIESL